MANQFMPNGGGGGTRDRERARRRARQQREASPDPDPEPGTDTEPERDTTRDAGAVSDRSPDPDPDPDPEPETEETFGDLVDRAQDDDIAVAGRETPDERPTTPQDRVAQARQEEVADIAQTQEQKEELAQQRREFAGEVGVHPHDIRVESVGDDVRMEVREPAIERQIADEHGASPGDVEIDDGEVEVDVDDGRDGAWGWLEDRSAEWQAGAETVGDWVEDAAPGVPVVAPGPEGVPQPMDEDFDEVAGGAAETGVGIVDPAGAVLFGEDVARGAAREYEGWTQYRLDQEDDLDVTDITEDPQDTLASIGDAATGAGYLGSRAVDAGAAAGSAAGGGWETFQDRPFESAARVGTGAGAAIAGPTAAVRGAQRAGRLDWSPRGDMISRGPDRGQMDMTIQRQRRRDPDELPPSEQPADPTAPTAEGRTPPREAFPSDEAYQQALRRRGEEIRMERADQQPLAVGADATPVEQVRARRHLFDDHAEFQRELQAAREQMQRARLDEGADTVAAMGDPTATTTITAEAHADVDTSLDTDAMFTDPSAEETIADEDTVTALDEDAMLTADTTTTTDVTTTTAMEEQMAMDMPTQTVTRQAARQPPATRMRALLPETDPDPVDDPESDWGIDDAAWETGIADPDDVWPFDSDDDIDDNGNWGGWL